VSTPDSKTVRMEEIKAEGRKVSQFFSDKVFRVLDYQGSYSWDKGPMGRLGKDFLGKSYPCFKVLSLRRRLKANSKINIIFRCSVYLLRA